MKYKTTQKDRYGNMRSLEIDTGENNMEVPPMTSMIPQYEAVGGLAENHPGEPKGSDTVPAWLTPGEFVVNKEAVDMYGPQIKKMNDAGRAVQDGNMNPNQAPPVYATAGQEISNIEQWKKELMQREGGYRSDIYDPFPDDGVWEPTTGYGHLLDKNLYTKDMLGKPGPFKTEAAAKEQFNKDIGNALIDAQANIGEAAWAKLQPQQQWGLTNMAFQLGRTKQAKFKNMIESIKAGNYEDAKMHAAYNRNKNTQEYDIKTGWHSQTPTRVDDFLKFMTVIPDSPTSKPNVDAAGNITNLEVETPPTIPSTPEEPGNRWNLLNLFGGNSSNDNLPEDVTTADVNEGSVPHTVIPTPGPPPSKPVIPRDEATAESAFNLWDGGLIPGIDYPSEYKDDEWWWGDSRTSSPTPVTNPGFKDYGELIPRLPIDYDPQGTGGMPEMEKVDPAFQNILRQSTSPDLTTSEEEAVVPNVNKLPINNLNIENDMTSRTDMGSSGVNLFNTLPEFPEKYRSADTPAPDYGEAPAFETTPFGTIDDMPSEYRPNTNWLPFTDSRTGSPKPGSEPKGWVDPLDRPIDIYKSFADTDMPIDTAEEIGIPRSNMGTSDYENRMEDLLPLEAQTSMADLESLYRNNESPIPEMFGPDVIGSFSPDERIDPVAGDFSPDKNAPDKIDTSMWDAGNSSYNHHFEAKGYKDKINVALTKIDKLRKENPNDPKIDELRKDIVKWEERHDFHKKAEASIKSSRENKKSDKELYKDAELIKEIVDLEKYINSESTTQSEKERAQERLDILNAKYKETGLSKLTTDLNANEKQLKEIVKNNHIDNKKEDEISAKLSSKTGEALMESESNDPNKWGKAEEMLKGTLGFLFGDLFDSGELGRAIAVYLGSRALGYQHGESIGYVSKQYLKRVDAKNAAYDKWLLANSGKYTKKSLSKFKKTRDPAHLIPIGSVPRSQGEQSKWYDKNGQARMAYKFKIKDAAGDDHVYWSWDKDGKSDVKDEEGWHQDAKNVPGTTEFKEQARKYRNDIEEQLKVLKDKYDIHKNRDDDAGIYTNKYHTTITPEIDKDAVYDWAIDRGVQPEKIGSFLEQAMILATKEARVSSDKPGTIIPYLDRVTIDEQTKNVPELLKDGDHELDTPEATALNKKITENFGAPTIFYNSAWDEYQKGKRKSDGKPWSEVFKEIAADPSKNENNWTPFALFTDNLLYEWMKETKAKRGSGDFTLNKFGKD